ncbi:MAG: mannose-6-phosphate isomerase-like protein (cupin superfamily) [Kiritimatiellia bacterium]|jgi:mannose-6-phosphate isomerase-like protein (cupin superfamily)
MSLIIEKGHFEGLSGALADIRDKGLFPTTYATDKATAANIHWHTEEVLAYLIQGRTYFLDANGKEHQLEPGDLITVPARTLHAEGDINEPVVMLIGLSDAVPMDRFLLPRDPAELQD